SIGSGNALFACNGSSVMRSVDAGGTWTTASLPTGTCQGFTPLAIVPDGTNAPTAVVALHDGPEGLNVTLLDVGTAASTSLGFPAMDRGNSGQVGVWTARYANGLGYDVFAANNTYYGHWSTGTSLNQFVGRQADTRNMSSL